MLCHSDAVTQPIIDPRPELNYRTVNGKLRFIWESLPERGDVVMHGDVINDVGHRFWTPIHQAGVRHTVVETQNDLPGCTMVKSTLTECPAEKVVRETWDLIEKEKCTIASLQPSMIQMLSSHCEDIPEPHWKLKVLSTTGFVRQSVMDAIGWCTDAIVTCYSLIEAGVVSRLTVSDTTKTRYTEGCVGDLTDPVRTRSDTKGPGSAKPTKVQAALPVKRYRASFLFMALIFSFFILSCEAKKAENTNKYKFALTYDEPLCEYMRGYVGSLANSSNTLKAIKDMFCQKRKIYYEIPKSVHDAMIQNKHDFLTKLTEVLKDMNGNK